MFNIVTGVKNFPEAVLVRGVENFNGPGKLTKALKIDKTLNREDLVDSNKLWLEDDGCKFSFETKKRIGIDYASDEYKNKQWRFILRSKA